VAVVTEQTTHAPVTSNAMAWRPQEVDLPGARDARRSGNWMTPGSPAEYVAFMIEMVPIPGPRGETPPPRRSAPPTQEYGRTGTPRPCPEGEAHSGHSRAV